MNVNGDRSQALSHRLSILKRKYVGAQPPHLITALRVAFTHDQLGVDQMRKPFCPM
jgi:hypothetical protein